MTYFVYPGIKRKPIIPPKALPLPEQKRIANNIITAICKYLNVEVYDLFKKGRKENIVICRQISMYLMRKYAGMSFSEIARMFDKDHTTILWAYKQVSKQIANKTDSTYKKVVDDITLMI